MVVERRSQTILLTFAGEMAGMVVGILLAKAIGIIKNTPVAISVFSIIVGAGFSVMTGILSGICPALKASKLNPTEAPRYESCTVTLKSISTLHVIQKGTCEVAGIVPSTPQDSSE